MSCHDASAVLVGIGLVFELGAVISVIWKFRPRRRPTSEPVVVELDSATGISGAGNITVSGSVTESHDPVSLDVLRARLDAIEERLAVEVKARRGEIDQLGQELRREMIDTAERTTEEAIRRSEEIHELIRAQTREALAEQKREGFFFGLGIGLQLVAVVLTLTC